MFKPEQGSIWKETNTQLLVPVAPPPRMDKAGQFSVVTQCSPWTHPLTEFFSSEWEFLVKLCFDRETGGARQGPVLVLCSGTDCKLCIYANPLPCPAHTRLEEEGESKATLKTLSKNGKALFNFTNKIILKSLCQLFACDLIMEEYVTIYG